MTTKNQIVDSLEGLIGGSVYSNFPSNDITKIGLVRTHSIQNSIHKMQKSSGFAEGFKTKNPDSKPKSRFFSGPARARTADPLIMIKMLR